jgi:hypothetical protein
MPTHLATHRRPPALEGPRWSDRETPCYAPRPVDRCCHPLGRRSARGTLGYCDCSTECDPEAPRLGTSTCRSPVRAPLVSARVQTMRAVSRCAWAQAVNESPAASRRRPRTASILVVRLDSAPNLYRTAKADSRARRAQLRRQLSIGDTGRRASRAAARSGCEGRPTRHRPIVFDVTERARALDGPRGCRRATRMADELQRTRGLAHSPPARHRQQFKECTYQQLDQVDAQPFPTILTTMLLPTDDVSTSRRPVS